jgi:hypothetical protein
MQNITLLLDKFSKLAYQAFYWTSFDPEKRGKQTIESYSHELTQDLEGIPEEERERYQTNYEKYFSAWLSAHSRCASSAVTGPANFPARRIEKANKAEQNRFKEFIEWREKAHKAIAKKIEQAKPESQKQNEKWLTLKKGITRSLEIIAGIDNGTVRGTSRPLIVSNICNKIKVQAKNGETEVVNNALDYIEQINSTLEKPAITKNNSIWKLREQAEAKREAIVDASVRESEETEHNGIRIVTNYQQDRVQIIFPGKPASDVIQKLKRNAWRWSPSNTAWQRKLTRQAQLDACNIVK